MSRKNYRRPEPKLRVSLATTLHRLRVFLQANAQLPHGERMSTGTRMLVEKVYVDFVMKILRNQRKLHHRTHRYTYSNSNLAAMGNSCYKTAQNRTWQMEQAGVILPHWRTRDNFGKGEINCLAFDLNPDLVSVMEELQHSDGPAVDKPVDSGIDHESAAKALIAKMAQNGSKRAPS